MLSPESVKKFQKIYRAEFGVDLPFEEAQDEAQRFLNVVRIVLQPMPKAWEGQYLEALKRVGGNIKSNEQEGK